MRHRGTGIAAGVVVLCALLALAGSFVGGVVEAQAAIPDGPVLSAGAFNTCALVPTGAIDCWGFNHYGEADDKPGPFTTLSTREGHTCALTPPARWIAGATTWRSRPKTGRGRTRHQRRRPVHLRAGGSRRRGLLGRQR